MGNSEKRWGFVRQAEDGKLHFVRWAENWLDGMLVIDSYTDLLPDGRNAVILVGFDKWPEVGPQQDEVIGYWKKPGESEQEISARIEEARRCLR